MGKSWKGKGRYSAERIRDYKWSSQCYSLAEILENFKLPVVVQCRDETRSVQLEDGFFQLHQPLLLYKRRQVRKVFSRCVRKGPGGTLKELSPEVVIPEDYAGWFKISKGLSFSKPVPHYTLESVYECPSEFFLCTTEFNALILSGSDDDLSDDASATRPIVEGEVLRKTGIHTVNQMMLPPSHYRASLGNRYLMCIDEKDSEVLLPLKQQGLFYEVADADFERGNGVLQIRDILDEMMQFPLFVRHILGDPPPVSKFYSPCLKLDRVLEEETIMGTTLDRDDLIPLEMQTNSPIKFEIALNTPKLQTSLDYVEALGLCSNVCKYYVTDMKLAVTYVQRSAEAEQSAHVNQSFVPDEQEVLPSVSNSQRTSFSTGHSDLGEVEANSEFTIQWDPGPDTSLASAVNNSFVPDGDSDCNSLESFDDGNVGRFDSGMYAGRFMDAGEQLNGDACVWQRRHFSDSELNGDRFAGPMGVMETLFIHAPPKTSLVSQSADHSDQDYVSPRDEVSTVDAMTIKPPSPKMLDVNVDRTAVTVKELDSSTFTDEDDDDVDDNREHMHVSRNKYHSVAEITLKQDQLLVKPRNTRHSAARDSPFFEKELRRAKAEASSDFPMTKERLSEGGSDISTLTRSDSESSLNETEFLRSLTSLTSGSRDRDSYADLRSRLMQCTEEARQKHQEDTWDAFCLERSASLPLPDRTTPQDVYEASHSQSWEQISNSKAKVGRSNSDSTSKLRKTLHRLNVEYNRNSDRTQLIEDTSSDESIHSFTIPTDLALIPERDRYDPVAERRATSLLIDAQQDTRSGDVIEDEGVKEAEEQRAAILFEIMKIRHEIKRKKHADWNEECSEI